MVWNACSCFHFSEDSKRDINLRGGRRWHSANVCAARQHGLLGAAGLALLQ